MLNKYNVKIKAKVPCDNREWSDSDCDIIECSKCDGTGTVEKMLTLADIEDLINGE